MLGRNMRFSTVMLMVLTPIGVAIGLHEAWRLAGGLVVLMAVQVLVMSLVAVSVVRTIKREGAKKETEKTSP
jgi:RsiW-degrading membrane proteinase PrsW (M82 family)